MDSLAARLIDKAVVYPTIRVASHPGKLLMGVYDDNGGYVDDTVLNRRAGEQGAPVPQDLFPVVIEADEPEAIYAGPLYFHFGHFLLESLARAWYAHRYPNLPFAWAGQHDWREVELRPWQREILDILMIKNPTSVITQPTRFSVLHVPDIGYRYDDRFHPEHAKFLARYEGPTQDPGHRLWVSRSRIGSDVRDLNSEPTERRLAEAGWTVTYPEVLSIREQLDNLSRAEIVAGEEGSAFHTLLLLKDVASKEFHIFRRHGPEHGNLHTIGDARRVNQSFYSLQRQLVLKADGRFVSKINPNSTEILDILKVPVPIVRTGAPSSVIKPLERILATFEPRRFLDVGASDPDLVIGAAATARVAVSPHFGFDPRTHATAGIDFYELGLEQYADLFYAGLDPFDVIRIDGSTFQDVMASFGISKRLAHSNTKWILGSGDLAARVALAIRLTHPGFTAGRMFGERGAVYVGYRMAGEPTDEAGVGELPAAEVQRRLRWVRPAGLRSALRRIAAKVIVVSKTR